MDVLRNANPKDSRTFITYSQAHVRLGIPIIFGHPGRSLQEQGLNSLAKWAHGSDVPAITGLIVRDAERDPGQGYFDLYRKRYRDDIPWWIEEIRRAKQLDWSPYLDGTSAPVSKRAEKDARAQPAPITVASVVRSDSRFFPQIGVWSALFRLAGRGFQLQPSEQRSF